MRSEEKRTLLRLIGMRLFLFALLATTSLAQALRFDVASVRPNTLDDRIVTIDPGPNGRFSARGYSLKLLIQHAYTVKGFQIGGGPGWLDVDRYDILARGRSDATPEQLRLMLRALLEERFALRVHRIQKEMPGFELSVTGAQSKLKPSGASNENADMRRDATGALVANGISMPAFATIVSAYLAKPVVDKTRLPGLYDFRILWTERADQVPDAESTGVSLISALRDQLGLKLTSKRVTAEVIVIDRAAKATPN